MLPKHSLLALAFRRTPSPIRMHPISNSNLSPTTTTRALSTSQSPRKWEGRKASENTTREPDSHNVQIDASKAGKEERAKGQDSSSRGTSEESGGSNEKAKKEFPEAPDTIGMQDERGGKN